MLMQRGWDDHPYDIKAPLLEWCINCNEMQSETSFLYSSCNLLTYCAFVGYGTGTFKQHGPIVPSSKDFLSGFFTAKVTSYIIIMQFNQYLSYFSCSRKHNNTPSKQFMKSTSLINLKGADFVKNQTSI
jgi:hypothetical protein